VRADNVIFATDICVSICNASGLRLTRLTLAFATPM
jgi:hypothetical protein